MSTELEKADSHTLLELKKYVKADSKAHILSCLTRVKGDTQCCKRFLKAGGLELLVQLLRYQDLKIMNVSLSILANICMNSDTRQQVRESNIVAYTLWILKNLKVNDNLHCRACRLIGNLSDCSWHAKAFYDAGAVQALSDILRTKINTQTYLMGIRAVRNIWTMHEGSRKKIIDSDIIKTITAIFIEAGQKSCEMKYIELAETCLKALCAFLVGSNYECAKQMIGEHKEGFKTFVNFCKTQNKLAIKCLHGLAMIPECRPALGECDAVETVVNLVETCPFYFGELVAILCLFCREAVNRIRIRYCSGIQVILNILKKEENEKYHPVLLHGLAQFLFDDEGMLIMTKNGLLEILTTKLKRMALEESLVKIDEKSTSKKRSGDRSPYRKLDVKYNRTSLGRFSLDYQDDWSPKSARSDSSTPPSTPPMKLFHDKEDSDDNGEENYSPVCSENEWAEEEPQDDVESLKSFCSATIEVDDTQDSWKDSRSELKKHVSAWTLALLSKLSYSEDPIDKLADPATIEPLANYVKWANNPKAVRILIRIVKNKAYLIPLVKQGFVFEALRLCDSEQYTRQMNVVAETGGAIGELSSILLRGSEDHRIIIAVSIPFIIKSKDLLRCLLKNHGGLPLIFDILSDRKHALHSEAVLSICQLANLLDVRPDAPDRNQSVETTKTVDSTMSCGIENHAKPSTVTFELDDGTTIDACRRTLCQRSDAFSAMLEGNFSESGKRRVKLRNTSKEGLSTLLLAADGSAIDNRTIESLLDAVLLADKFLMPDVSEQLTESSISQLSHENFSRAWAWARLNECQELRLCCVKSFLTTKMTREQRLQAFRDFSKNDNFKEFLEEVREIVSTVLAQR